MIIGMFKNMSIRKDFKLNEIMAYKHGIKTIKIKTLNIILLQCQNKLKTKKRAKNKQIIC